MRTGNDIDAFIADFGTNLQKIAFTDGLGHLVGWVRIQTFAVGWCPVWSPGVGTNSFVACEGTRFASGIEQGGHGAGHDDLFDSCFDSRLDDV